MQEKEERSEKLFENKAFGLAAEISAVFLGGGFLPVFYFVLKPTVYVVTGRELGRGRCWVTK